MFLYKRKRAKASIMIRTDLPLSKRHPSQQRRRFSHRGQGRGEESAGSENFHHHFNLLRALIPTRLHYRRDLDVCLLILRRWDWSREGWIRCREEVQVGFDGRI
jgi:hypothetical protein